MTSPLQRAGAAAAALALLCVAGCGGTADGADPSADLQTTALAGDLPADALVTVDSTTVEAPLSLAGQLYVERDAVVLARAAGLVETIGVDLGSRVGAGQLLARLESTDQEIALARAAEDAANAERIAVRQRALAEVGGVTAAELDAAESELRRARIQLRQAERDMALTRVTAPFAGVVTARMARARRLVGVGDSLFRVTATSPLLVSVRVPERAAGLIRTGTSARVTGLNGKPARARVIRASPAIDAGSGTREFVLQVESGSRLMPGASVTVELGAESRRVLAMPSEAVVENGYALVWADSRTTLRPVTLGASLADGRVEVVSGLAPGETVVRSAP